MDIERASKHILELLVRLADRQMATRQTLRVLDERLDAPMIVIGRHQQRQQMRKG